VPAFGLDPAKVLPVAYRAGQHRGHCRQGVPAVKCSYCATGKGNRGWGSGSDRSLPCCNEIRAASAGRQVGFVDFEDENLTMDRRWFLSNLMEGIREIFGDSLPELRAMNGLFPPTLTETVCGP
jgi:hypothetical protein